MSKKTNTLLRFISIFFLFNPLANSAADSLPNKEKIINLLMDNSEKNFKDYCEISTKMGSPLSLDKYFKAFFKWTLLIPHGEESFECKKIEKQYKCMIRFRVKATEKTPAGDSDLEFIYSQKHGVDWKSLACVNTP